MCITLWASWKEGRASLFKIYLAALTFSDHDLENKVKVISALLDWEYSEFSSVAMFLQFIHSLLHGITSNVIYWWAPNYRKNSFIGCRLISRTSNGNIQNLFTVSSSAWEIKDTLKKLIKLWPKINISQLKMCFLPIPRPYERAGEVAYSQTIDKNISMHPSSVFFTGYFDLKTPVFYLLKANYN